MPLNAAAQAPEAPAGTLGPAVQKQVLAEFSALLSLKNVATDRSDIQSNADYLAEALRRRGFDARLLHGSGGSPAVFGELRTSGAARTVLFYAHYDGQPAGQPDWRAPAWRPVVRASTASSAAEIDWRRAAELNPEWRLFARSTSDDKASIQALLSALDRIRATGRKPSINIKVFYDGEEEQGSPFLGEILRTNRALLQADAIIFGDGPRHQSGAMQVIYGVRGSSTLDITTYGPARPLHSGTYGNWAPNPAVTLAHLLASMRREDGRILIDGFYDDVTPLTDEENRQIAALPNVETALRQELRLGRTELDPSLTAAVSQPALNIRGIRVGDVGDNAANVISPEAHGSIDFRLVPGQDADRIRALTEAHMRKLGWHVVHLEPTPVERSAHAKVAFVRWGAGYPAYRSRPDDPAMKAIAATIGNGLDHPLVRLPMIGGSIPVHDFASVLAVPIIVVPIANFDNNQHAANENIRLGNLWDGIAIYERLITSLDW